MIKIAPYGYLRFLVVPPGEIEHKPNENNMKTKQLGLLMVTMVAILMLPVGLALADTTTEGGVHEGVLVRHTFEIHQDKYDYAN